MQQPFLPISFMTVQLRTSLFSKHNTTVYYWPYWPYTLTLARGVVTSDASAWVPSTSVTAQVAQ